MSRVDVAIVGFGPSGAVAAGLLAAQGLTVHVCDRLAEVYDKPRAISLDHEILRVFQQMGVLDQIEPHTEPFTDSVWHGVTDQPIRRMSTVPPPFPLAHTPSIVFTQPPVEKILRAHAQSFSGVQVDLGTELIGLVQHPDSVDLQLREIASGRVRSIEASWVIGCDGASSTVRTLTGLGLDDLAFDERWLVVDLLVGDKALARLPQTSAQYCRPERPVTYLICPGRHRRWEIAINADEDPQQVATPEGTWALLAPWLAPHEATLWRQAAYRFHALVAKSWRERRVFLAGDAAHQQPPFLGQGMCQGLRDVSNLSWKLGAVIRGEAPPKLLDSYGLERRGHVTALTTRIKHIGQLIGERDPARARERDARLVAESGGVVRPTPRQDVQPPLAEGLLSRHPHAARGTLFPQPWLLDADGMRVRMDDRLGCGWRLILAPGTSIPPDFAPAIPAVRLARLGDPDLIEADGVLAAWFSRHAVTAAVVRPDHYVFGVADGALPITAVLSELRIALN